ncbi:MAG: L-serine ammonia-lyase [Steroidobacteraceae bacterium]
MNLSVFDIFKIGIGPSSSHTVGPMNAARDFFERLQVAALLTRTAQIVVRLYGSLALTGKGHGTDRAILLGLEGHRPDAIDPDRIDDLLATIRREHRIVLGGSHAIAFDEPMQLLFLREQALPEHSNGMRFTAIEANEAVLLEETYFSVGGGFIVRAGDDVHGVQTARLAGPFPFDTAAELLQLCEREGLEIFQLVRANERTWRSDAEIDQGLARIWEVMQACAQRGFMGQGLLPGALRVRRRAPKLYRQLTSQSQPGPMDVMDWVNAVALAVNEENAAGGRVVTAPTNGAAGIIPAVLHYYTRFETGADETGVQRFLLTAGAIGMLYKQRASLSGAELGCQGEVGVACSMAAAGLAAALNATQEQIENAAEIGMEHNLGLTCDPVGGLVQIPCIERNAMGAVKAINAARLAMRGDGSHKVSLDQVIATMRQTGRDMLTIYKETSQGGLAVNVPEC